MISRTSHSVSIGPASSDPAVGNQSIRRPSAMPQIDASAPMANIRPRYSRSRFSTSPTMEAASYATRAAEGTAVGRGLGGVRQALRRHRAEAAVPVAGGAAVGPERGRREALMAPERLGELGGLAVADAVRHFPHSQPA